MSIGRRALHLESLRDFSNHQLVDEEVVVHRCVVLLARQRGKGLPLLEVDCRVVLCHEAFHHLHSPHLVTTLLLSNSAVTSLKASMCSLADDGGTMRKDAHECSDQKLALRRLVTDLILVAFIQAKGGQRS
eukprot:3038963-Rhodomonas_salina.3